MVPPEEIKDVSTANLQEIRVHNARRTQCLLSSGIVDNDLDSAYRSIPFHYIDSASRINLIASANDQSRESPGLLPTIDILRAAPLLHRRQAEG